MNPPVAVMAIDPANRRRKLIHAFDDQADESLCEYVVGGDVGLVAIRDGDRQVLFADLVPVRAASRICGPCARIHRIRWPDA